MMAPMSPLRRRSGFTLVEAVVVIVITGILGGIVVLFIRWPVQNYVDSVARAELVDTADMAMRRMAREVRRALPNSVRVSGGTAVEFMPTKTGGRYLAAEDEIDPTANAASGGSPALSFIDPAALTFRVVGDMPTGQQAIVAGDAIVVYNLGPGFDRADAYTLSNRAVVASVSNNVVSMTANPFAGGDPATAGLSSPGRRFQVVGSPVMYVCNLANRSLTRMWNYTPSATMTVPPSGATLQTALLATNVTECGFNYSDLKNTRSALLGMTIGLQRLNNSDSVLRLVHQVHVDNVP